MSTKRIEIAHFMHDFADNSLAIIVPEDDLVQVSPQRLIGPALLYCYSWAWMVISVIFAACVLPTAVNQAFSIPSIWSSAFKLFAISIGQDTRNCLQKHIGGGTAFRSCVFQFRHSDEPEVAIGLSIFRW